MQILPQLIPCNTAGTLDRLFMDIMVYRYKKRLAQIRTSGVYRTSGEIREYMDEREKVMTKDISTMVTLSERAKGTLESVE